MFFTTKNKKGGGERSLFSSSHFCHHVEIPFVGALLKLLALEVLIHFMFLKL
jgi:hypothetical protein